MITEIGRGIGKTTHIAFPWHKEIIRAEYTPDNYKKANRDFYTQATFSENPGRVRSASGLEASSASWAAGQLGKSYISSVPRWPGSRPPPSSR